VVTPPAVLGEDARRLRQQRDAVADLVVRHRVDRALRAPRQVERIPPVRGVPDGERLGDRVRLDRPADVVRVLEGPRDGRAPVRLRPWKAGSAPFSRPTSSHWQTGQVWRFSVLAAL
jgi:hypothetical protein